MDNEKWDRHTLETRLAALLELAETKSDVTDEVLDQASGKIDD